MPAENPSAVAESQELHVWEAGGADSAEALSGWIGARLAAHEAALAALLAVEGERTTENSLRLFDAALEQLSLAGAQAGVLNSVAALERVEPEPRGLRRSLGYRARQRKSGDKALRRAHAARLPAGWRGQGSGHARSAAIAP